MAIIELASLSLLHQNHPEEPSWLDQVEGFHFKTCIRKGVLTTKPLIPHPVSKNRISISRGIDGYSKLLEICTGLDSPVVGETDVFGQIKASWNVFSDLKNPLARELKPWMDRLFEDTKEIRSLYLQNLGGHSYGSLARTLMKEHLAPEARVFFVGAGILAESMLPFFKDYHVTLANRTLTKAESLASLTSPRPKIVDWEKEPLAWENSDLVIVCVPPDDDRDSWRTQSLTTTLHLGIRAETLGLWQTKPSLFHLDHLFHLSEERSKLRFTSVERARFACLEKAKLRELDPIPLAHGWEDLLTFQA